LLREFWNVCRGDVGRANQMAGFNTHLFDLPFLIRRSWKHQVAVPFDIHSGRFWGEEMVDLRDVWQLGDRQGWDGPKPVRHHDYINAADFPRACPGRRILDTRAAHTDARRQWPAVRSGVRRAPSTFATSAALKLAPQP
jgi:hypothetical protein